MSDVDLFGVPVMVVAGQVRAVAQPQATTAWMVATWYAPHCRWKVWPEQWANEPLALRQRDDLLRLNGHTHGVVLRVDLPSGEK